MSNSVYKRGHGQLAGNSTYQISPDVLPNFPRILQRHAKLHKCKIIVTDEVLQLCSAPRVKTVAHSAPKCTGTVGAGTSAGTSAGTGTTSARLCLGLALLHLRLLPLLLLLWRRSLRRLPLLLRTTLNTEHHLELRTHGICGTRGGARSPLTRC